MSYICKFSLIVPIYKVEKYLDQCISSIVKQTLDFKTHVELILVNDGSPDNCDEICKKWQQLYPENIKYIYKENGGAASARNIGLEHASYEWISFPDPDDWFENTYLEKVSNAITQIPDVDIVSANVVNFFAVNNKYVYHPVNSENNIVILSHQVYVRSTNVNVTFFKSSIIKKNNLLFNPKVPLGDDFDFHLRYILHSNCLHYVTDAIYYLRKRGDGTSYTDNSFDIWKRIDQIKNSFIPIMNKAKHISDESLKAFIIKYIYSDLYCWCINIIGQAQLDDNNIKDLEELLYLFKELFKDIDLYQILNTHNIKTYGVIYLFTNKEYKINTINIVNYNKQDNTITFKYEGLCKQNLKFYAGAQELFIQEIEINDNNIYNNTITLYKEIYYKVSIKNVNPYCCLSVIDNEGKYLDIRINHANVMSNGLYSIANIIKHLNNNHKHKTPAIQNTMYIKETYKNYILFSKYKYKDIKHSMILKYKLLGFITLFKKYISYHDGKKTKKYVFFNLFTICK